MRHGYKKIKFNYGRDAKKMLLRKLAINFFSHGKITTTFKRAKVLKSWVEKLVEKSKAKTEANKNFLMKYLANKKIINFLFDQAGPVIKDKTGGYVRVIKLDQRPSDGSLMCRLEWVYPVVKNG
jgi:large subunit ribosomal protein L17